MARAHRPAGCGQRDGKRLLVVAVGRQAAKQQRLRIGGRIAQNAAGLDDEAGARHAQDGPVAFQFLDLVEQVRVLFQVIDNAGHPRLSFDARAIDTYGTVLACAEMLVGEHGMIDAGMPQDVTNRNEVLIDRDHLIEILEAATSAERADQVPKWLDVIEKILGAKLDAYKGGEKQTVGGVIETLEDTQRGDFDIIDARQRLALMGLGIRDKGDPAQGYTLAIPHSDDNLDRLFADSDFHHGGWTLALKQAPETVVLRTASGEEGKRLKTVKINRLSKTCTLVDLKGYDAWMEG